MSAQRAKRIGEVLCAASGVLAVLCIVLNRHWFYDDAYITLRYAKHLAAGLGPRWNLTGAPVEGFTSPLHVLLIAFLQGMRVPGVFALRALAFLSHAAVSGFVWCWVRERSGRLAAAIAASGIGASFAMLLWDLGGLEAVPYAALLTAGTLQTLAYLETASRRTLAVGGLLLGLAAFTRLDALPLIAYLAFCLMAVSKTPRSRRLLDALMFLVIALACLVPWQIYRMHVFQDVLPNTYYAKLYGIPRGWLIGSGRHYVHLFVTEPPYSLPVLAAVAVLQCLRRAVSRTFVVLWGSIAVMVLYVIWSGGDHMYGFRFMVPVIPLIGVALAMGLQALQLLAGNGRAAATVGFLLLLQCLQMRSPVLDRRGADPTTVQGIPVARFIATNFPPATVIALDAAGTSPYFADRMNYIDMLGLNDREIARRAPMPLYPNAWLIVGHLKADAASVLRRKPDVIVLGPPAGLPASAPVALPQSDVELIRSPAFAADYKFCVAPLPLTANEAGSIARAGSNGPQSIEYYIRHDGRVRECASR